MAGPNQTWARDPEIAASGTDAHPSTPGDSRPYADTNRLGSTVKDHTSPIMAVQNKITDPDWGIQAPAG